jgi:hypothetical protein
VSKLENALKPKTSPLGQNLPLLKTSQWQTQLGALHMNPHEQASPYCQRKVKKVV